MAMSSLTALERETIITMNDEEDFMVIYTAQKPRITNLKKNPSATLVEEGKYGKTAWARFELPANLFANPLKGKKKVSVAQKKGLAKRMSTATTCSATTQAGKPCKAKATKSGKCYKHQ